jgi:hypothetical protein
LKGILFFQAAPLSKYLKISQIKKLKEIKKRNKKLT